MLNPGTSLWDLVARRAAATPGALMAVDEAGRTLTYGDYRDRAERAAAGLAQRGVGEGTPVSWSLPTWFESMVLVAALARLGAVQNPLLPIYREREVAFAVRQTEAGLLIVPDVWRGYDYEAMARAITHDVLVVPTRTRALPDGDPATLGAAAGAAGRTPAAADTAPVRWVFYTSGTTADPKGARHSDATLIAAGMATVAPLAPTPDDRSALVFPFTHIGGISGLVSSLVSGAVSILDEAFDPARTVELLAREGVTLAGAGTAFWMAYLAAQRRQLGRPLFPRVRAFPGGGAPKPAQLHYDIKAELGGVGIVSGYGLTECPTLSMNTTADPDDKLARTEGRPTAGVQVRIVRMDGEEARPGEEGEIRATGPQLFRGYVDAALDRSAFDERGFLRTGDLGSLDVDGYVTVTGRLKDVIIRKGENISAREVEELLHTHPAVADVAVIGLPDPELGERGCAVVVPADPVGPPTLAELTTYLRGRGLMVQKLPEQLELVAELPRNPTGKILKHRLREQFAPPGYDPPA